MLKRTLHFLANGLAVFLSADFLTGVSVDNYWSALLTAVVISLLNVLIKPFLVILSLPVTILTLGLFTWVIDVVIIMLAAYIVPGFTVDGFITGLLFALIMAVVSFLFNKILDILF